METVLHQGPDRQHTPARHTLAALPRPTPERSSILAALRLVDAVRFQSTRRRSWFVLRRIECSAFRGCRDLRTRRNTTMYPGEGPRSGHAAMPSAVAVRAGAEFSAAIRRRQSCKPTV
jgi:hypothetical protein